MSANDMQVGGTHYQAEIQHWDLIEDYGIGYLEGCATKYLTRYPDKGQALKDLNKADHYVMKLIEKAQNKVRVPRLPRGHVPEFKVVAFLEANNVGPVAGEAIRILVSEWTIGTLSSASKYIVELIREEEERA